MDIQNTLAIKQTSEIFHLYLSYSTLTNLNRSHVSTLILPLWFA